MTRGGAASSAKGTRYEQELVATLRDLGFGVLRCPSSGSATDEDLPDIIAGQGVMAGPALDHETFSDAWAIEHKAGDATTLYVDADEVEALSRFAGRFGATTYLGARFTTKGSPTMHYLVRPQNARKTDGGNYGLPIDDIDERASVRIHPGDEPAVEGGDE